VNKLTVSMIDHLKHVLDTSIEFLQTVRETSWAGRLKELRVSIETDPVSGARNVLRAFEGDESFERLYLSGPRNGHNLSERQEIEANGKLHIIQTEMRKAAGEVARMAR
jgi:hypothetical protein